MSAVVPILVPRIITLAPANGSPSAVMILPVTLSATLSVTLLGFDPAKTSDAREAGAENNKHKIANANRP